MDDKATAAGEALPAEKTVEPEDILSILANRENDRGGLISILEEVQNRYGYLPEAALRLVSRHTGRSLVDIYGVATFYRVFSLQPKGEHLVCTCLGTACHVRGAAGIVAELERCLGIEAGQTTPDRKFTLETVNCLGACALGPVVVIDGRYFSKVRKAQIKQLIEQARTGLDRDDDGKNESVFPVEALCRHCGQSFRDEEFLVDGLPCLAVNGVSDSFKGLVRLSCLYGSRSVSTEFDIPAGEVVDFTCPHCDGEVRSSFVCSECEAPMLGLQVRGGGVLHLCSRRGCDSHMLDLN